MSEELVNAVNKVEDIILIALSCSDRDILADYVSEQLSLATNKMVQDGLEKILKQIKKGWTDIEDSPYALSVQYFGKNIFTLTPFQNRVAHLQETADQYFAEYELNPSTGEVEKRFKDGISKPNGEQFGNESDSTES